MADVQPLSDDERAELEALRAEKAARQERARAARERAELEQLRAEQAQAQTQADAARQQDLESVATPRSQPTRTPAIAEEDRRIAEAKARGAKLMEPDDDLSMPLGQKITLAVIAALVIIVVVMSRLLG